MKVVCISDTHAQLNKVTLPKGDILIHSGDHTYRGTWNEMSKAFKDLARVSKDFKRVVTICGNHDWLGELEPKETEKLAKDNGLIYLNDSGIELLGYKIYGSPIQPEFCNWAFNRYRGPQIRRYWDAIPDDTQILVTHGPPALIGDKCPDGFRAGCQDLFERVVQLKDLELHVFGHIHGGYGITHFDGITFVNASTCDEQYKPVNKPIVIEVE
jgi:Icc-related predicted phosphoesterase